MYRHFLSILILTSFHLNRISTSEVCPNETDFQCDNGECIDEKLVCNDQFNCQDESDETDCDFKKCKAPQWYLCNDNSTCISNNLRCDGHFDCPNEDDENKDDCKDYKPHHEKIQCSELEFTCLIDNLCLPMEHVCDGIKHCMDGSDESLGCIDIEKKCKGFLCKNKHCLTDSNWVCDGINDCGDNSDEEQNCVNNCFIEKRKFLCADNDTCIPVEKVCDGKNDCMDGSDESSDCKSNNKCSANYCPSDAECFNFPKGPKCICSPGYEYNERTKDCEDINECETFGICSQGCFNTKGSYKCVCAPKFKLKADNRSCETVNQHEDAILLYAGHKAVNGLTLKTKHGFSINQNLDQVIGISYDGHLAYWTDISLRTESILRARKDGSQIEILVTSGLGAPEDIAVDYYTGNIYFTDGGFMHVAVCSNDGRYCTALVTENVHRPRGIVLYPQKSTMYWSDWGDDPRINVAFMDGSEVRAFISDNIHWPNGLAVDWPNERLYWVDAKLKTIESIKLNGQDRRAVLRGVSKHPYAIAVFEDKIYWSDWDTKSIQSCNKFTGKHRETLLHDRKVYDVHIYHSAMQPHGLNSCSKNQCSHLCLLAENNTYSCACPKGMELGVDKHRCKASVKQQILLIGMGDRLISFEHQSFGKHNDGEGRSLPINIHKLAFNSVNGEVFVADNVRKGIYTVNRETGNTKRIIWDRIGNVSALSFDYLANNLYWTDSERSTVEVFSLNTQYRATIAHFVGAEIPSGLCVIPENGKIYIALRSLGHSHIDVISANGLGAHYHVLEEGLGDGPIQLVPDPQLHEVFYLDIEMSKIGFTDYEGVLHHTFIGGLINPASLAILGEDIFWTSSGTAKLYWTPKHNLGGTKKLVLHQPGHDTLPDSIEIASVTPLVVSKHRCAVNNGDCSHICTALDQTSYACVCPAGMVFKDGRNQTCIVSSECEFRCGSGECITKAERCNGFKNCVDNSDELNCGMANKTRKECTYNEFACYDGSACIPRKLRCDKNYDCADKSDEKDCEHYDHETQCHKYQFICRNGKCVDLTALCDGAKDCDNGEDEQDCGIVTCGPNMFKCNSGQCIHKQWVCDNSDDCNDGSDELNCPEKACPKDYFKCDHGQCIEKSLRCNGNNDCGDHSDESNCNFESDVDIVCGNGDRNMPDKFQCSSNKALCLDISVRCNGTSECPRGEDEANCTSCSIYEFQCDNKDCIRMDWRCDGQADCTDGSDEINCDKKDEVVISEIEELQHRCTADKFSCKDGTCVEWDKVCDNNYDCPNSMDENGMCNTSCSQGHPCEQKCIKSPFGPVCGCRDGYKLMEDKKTCVDIDECSNGDSPCAQQCENTVGSYRCSCFVGFSLRSDKTACKSLYEPKYMIYAAHNTIFKMEPHLSPLWSSNTTSKILDIDINYDRKLLYFTMEDTGALFELNMENKNVHVAEEIGKPSEIAVDWISNNVYLIDDSTEPTIKICHMGDLACVVLKKFKQKDRVKTIAVDPINNRLFYSILNFFVFSTPESRIIGENLDGTQSKEIVIKGGHYISALECDFYAQRLYFTDKERHSVWSVNYDGTEKREVISKNKDIFRPIDISIFENYATILNSASKVVVQCQLYGRKECKSFELNVNNPSSLIIVQKTRQKDNEDNCSNVNCSAICVPAGVGPKCLCDYGSFVGPNRPCENLDSNGIVKFRKHQTAAQTEGASPAEEAESIVGTVILLLLLVIIVMGGIFIYKRKFSQKKFNVSMHFQNPRATMDQAKVKICQIPEVVRRTARINEIFITKNGSTKENTIPEEEEMQLRDPDNYADDQKRRLIP